MRPPVVLASLLVLATASAEPVVPDVLKIGELTPEFELTGIDDRTYTLDDFSSAKALCLVVTCNHCPDAYAARHRIKELHDDYHPKGVALIAINGNNPDALRRDELGYSPYNDSFEEMKLFARDCGWTFPYLYDGETQGLTLALGAQATPHFFVFDQDRKLRYSGRMDDGRHDPDYSGFSYVRDALDAVLAGDDVEEPVTRAFGCSTKWNWKKSDVALDETEWNARPVTLEDLDDALARELRKNPTDKVRLINFWSTTCGPCLAEFPDLVDTYRRFQNRPFELITISLDPQPAAGRALKVLQKFHAAAGDDTTESLQAEGRTTNNYRFSGDNHDALAEAIDPSWSGAQPHSVIILPGGEIHWSHTDRFDPLELRKQILSAIAKLETP